MTRKIILAPILVLGAMTTMQAVASDKTDAMVSLHQFVDGFNRGDLKSAIAACADEASVVDDFPPYVWQDSGCGKWAEGFDVLVKKEGITEARMILGEPRHVDVMDDRAYIVVPVTLTYRVYGKPKKLPSMFTASMRRESNGWLITGWAWADL